MPLEFIPVINQAPKRPRWPPKGIGFAMCQRCLEGRVMRVMCGPLLASYCPYDKVISCPVSMNHREHRWISVYTGKYWSQSLLRPKQRRSKFHRTTLTSRSAPARSLGHLSDVMRHATSKTLWSLVDGGKLCSSCRIQKSTVGLVSKVVEGWLTVLAQAGGPAPFSAANVVWPDGYLTERLS